MCRSVVGLSLSEPGITGIVGFVGFNGSCIPPAFASLRVPLLLTQKGEGPLPRPRPGIPRFVVVPFGLRLLAPLSFYERGVGGMVGWGILGGYLMLAGH